MSSSFNIIQMTDLHLLSDPEGELQGVNTQHSLQAVIDLITKEDKQIELIILTGDLSQDGSEDAYLRLAATLKNFNVPVYCLPGNHDDAKMMSRLFPCDTISNHKHIILKNWQLILLNSQKEGAVEGMLCRTQLDYLRHCLESYPEHHASVFFHHPPLSVNCTWLDPIGLTNAEEFWELIANFPRLKNVIFGHIHQEFYQKKNDVNCYAAPSTCFQFKPKHEEFALDNIPPGYRVIQLHEDGRLETHVKRVAEYIGVFEADSQGY